MTSTRSEGVNTLLYLYVPIQIMSVYGYFTESAELMVLFVYNVIATLAHIHFGCCVVSVSDGAAIPRKSVCVVGSTDMPSFENRRF